MQEIPSDDPENAEIRETGETTEWEKPASKEPKEHEIWREQCPNCGDEYSQVQELNMFSNGIHEHRFCPDCRTKWINKFDKHRKVEKDE